MPTAVSNFNPSNDGDAGTDVGAPGDTWANLRGRTGDFSNRGSTDPNDVSAGIYASTVLNRWSTMARGIYLFVTQSLDPRNTIVSATLDLYITSVTTTLAAQSLVVVASNPASNTTLVNADASTLGTTALSTTITLASLSLNAYNSIGTLNATGLAAISLSSTPTKLGTRIESDRANAEPTWGSGVIAQAFNDFSSGTHPPRLVVTSTVPGTSRAYAFFMSIAGLLVLLGITRLGGGITLIARQLFTKTQVFYALT